MKVFVLKSDYHFITPGMSGEAKPMRSKDYPLSILDNWFEVSFSSVDCPVPDIKSQGPATFAFKRDQLEFIEEEIISKEDILQALKKVKNEPIFLPVDYRHQFVLDALCHIINDWATKKGWNDVPDSLSHKAECIALMHSELSECLEYLRKKEQPAMDDKVPELTGEAAELADVLIRIFHYCGKRNINLGEAVRLKHQFNITRPYRHGKLL